MKQTFLILATPNFEDGVIYQKTTVEVDAKSWDEAYQLLRDNKYTPFVDEYTPTPAQ